MEIFGYYSDNGSTTVYTWTRILHSRANQEVLSQGFISGIRMLVCCIESNQKLLSREFISVIRIVVCWACYPFYEVGSIFLCNSLCELSHLKKLLYGWHCPGRIFSPKVVTFFQLHWLFFSTFGIEPPPSIDFSGQWCRPESVKLIFFNHFNLLYSII